MSPAGHDPLCDVQHMTSCLWKGDVCQRCQLIRKVREDERAEARDEALYDAAWIPLRDVGVWGTLGDTTLVSAREVRTAILALRSQPITVDDTRRNLAAIDGLPR